MKAPVFMSSALVSKRSKTAARNKGGPKKKTRGQGSSTSQVRQKLKRSAQFCSYRDETSMLKLYFLLQAVVRVTRRSAAKMSPSDQESGTQNDEDQAGHCSDYQESQIRNEDLNVAVSCCHE